MTGLKEGVVYIKKYYSVIKKECNIPICDKMDGPKVYYAKVSGKKYKILYDFIDI